MAPTVPSRIGAGLTAPPLMAAVSCSITLRRRAGPDLEQQFPRMWVDAGEAEEAPGDLEVGGHAGEESDVMSLGFAVLDAGDLRLAVPAGPAGLLLGLTPCLPGETNQGARVASTRSRPSGSGLPPRPI